MSHQQRDMCILLQRSISAEPGVYGDKQNKTRRARMEVNVSNAALEKSVTQLDVLAYLDAS